MLIKPLKKLYLMVTFDDSNAIKYTYQFENRYNYSILNINSSYKCESENANPMFRRVFTKKQHAKAMVLG